MDDNGFAPYNADQQRAGGFAAGVSIGLVPFGSLVINTLIANGILAQGTPEAREGLAAGQAVGGILGLFWGGGKAPSAAPLQAPRPVPATVGGGSSPPLVVVPSGTHVIVGVGGAVTIAAAASELVVALSTGGSDSGGQEAGQGGKKRGPKTDPDAPHNAKIRAEAEALKAQGNTIVAGGGQEPERVIRTPGGHKESRRPDIVYQTPDGALRGRNVGQTRADGSPVKREVEALEDLNGPGGLPRDFVPYDR